MTSVKRKGKEWRVSVYRMSVPWLWWPITPRQSLHCQGFRQKTLLLGGNCSANWSGGLEWAGPGGLHHGELYQRASWKFPHAPDIKLTKQFLRITVTLLVMLFTTCTNFYQCILGCSVLYERCLWPEGTDVFISFGWGKHMYKQCMFINITIY